MQTLSSKKAKTVSDYISQAPADVRKKLTEMRLLTKKLIPRGEEVIKYGMPTIQVEGRNVIHYASMKGHLGFYPAPSGIKAFESDLKKQKINFSKGCIRFPYDMPLPIPLITKIIKFRMKEEKSTASVKAKPSNVVRGYTIKYHADGKTRWSKGKIKNGNPDGYWEWYRPDGTLKRSGTFKDGEAVGKWTTYDAKGRVYKVTEKK